MHTGLVSFGHYLDLFVKLTTVLSYARCVHCSPRVHLYASLSEMMGQPWHTTKFTNRGGQGFGRGESNDLQFFVLHSSQETQWNSDLILYRIVADQSHSCDRTVLKLYTPPPPLYYCTTNKSFSILAPHSLSHLKTWWLINFLVNCIDFILFSFLKKIYFFEEDIFLLPYW